MLVCHCRVVSDREIREAIASGAADVCAVAEICSGAGSRCGGCRPAIRRLLAEQRADAGSPRTVTSTVTHVGCEHSIQFGGGNLERITTFEHTTSRLLIERRRTRTVA